MSQNINASVRAIEPSGQHSAFQQKSAMEKNGLLPGTKNGPSEIFANSLTSSSGLTLGTTSGNMSLQSSGDVAITTTNASGKIYVDKSPGIVNFGIGTTQPAYPLHVASIGPAEIVGSSNGYIQGINGAIPALGNSSSISGVSRRICAKFQDNIWIDNGNAASYLFMTSDRRIKTNITDVPDDVALQKLRSIPCRYYDLIDNIANGSDTTIGFIAQEVKEVMPMSVTEQTSIVPDIYKIIDCEWNSNKMSSTELSDVSGIKYRFHVIDGDEEKRIDIIGNEDNTFTFDKEYEQVFCYGKEVNDLNILDQQSLYTLAFSATQEIDRIQQSHATEIESLKTQVAKLTALLEKNNIV